MAIVHPATPPKRVVIAGGGIAAVELLLALRHLAEDRASIALIAPSRELVYRPLAVAEPFGLGHAQRFDLDRIAEEHGARRHAAALAEVDSDQHEAITAAGRRLPYDLLAVTIGARPREAVAGALTLGGEAAFSAYRTLLDQLAPGQRLVFAVGGGVRWTLPLYELALMTSTWVAEHGLGEVALTIITPEGAPLEVFGRRAAEAVAQLLAERGIAVRSGQTPLAFEDGALVSQQSPDVPADHVVALPRLEGPAVSGLPHDDGGFIPTDGHGAVQGVDDVYAAGDATAFPVKQGGLAVQQADAVAEAIAARAGASVRPMPFDPVLRGLLLTGTIPHYLRAELGGGEDAEASAAEVEPVWWPPTKIAGGHLSHYLARLAAAQPPAADAVWLRIETDDLQSYLGPGGSATR